MVAPVITKPLLEINRTGKQMGSPSNAPVNDNLVWDKLLRQSSKQRPPYNLILPFSYERRTVKGFTPYYQRPIMGAPLNQITCSDGPSVPSVQLNFTNAVYAKAYAKFQNAVYSAAEVGLNLAERKQALGMMADRLFKIAAFAILLKKGRFLEASEFLGIKVNQKKLKKKKTLKNFGDNFLEYHFGWSPLIDDIQTAAAILSGSNQHSRSVRVRAGGSDTIPRSRVKIPNQYPAWKETSATGSVSCEMSATVTVVDDNALLFEQLGLNNPFKFVYELTPFSFVANWFFTIEEFLGSFTSFAGLSLTDQRVTTVTRTVVSIQQQYEWPYSYGGTFGYFGTIEKFKVTRQASINAPKLVLRSPWRLSTSRGLTAASLLAQQLR